MDIRQFGLGMAISAAFMVMVTACKPVQQIGVDQRIQIPWAERQLLFVADESNGQVRVFTTRAAPQQVAVLHVPGRRGVRDMKLDPGQGVLWVLGEQAVHGHDLHHHRMPVRHELPAAGAVRLEMAADGTLRLLGRDARPLAKVVDGRLLQSSEMNRGG